MNKLRELPLYEVDYGALHRADRDVFSVVVGSRRLVDEIGFFLYQKRNPDHMRRALDTVRERFAVRCGSLVHSANRAHST